MADSIKEILIRTKDGPMPIDYNALANTPNLNKKADLILGKIPGSQLPIDQTLTKTNYVADANVVGDEIRAIKKDVDNLKWYVGNESVSHQIKYALSQADAKRTSMILKSSTEGSKKNFEITVNDDGVISAVEVGGLIYFIVDAYTYQAEYNMTLNEWINSEYNTNGYTAESFSQFNLHDVIVDGSEYQLAEEAPITMIWFYIGDQMFESGDVMLWEDWFESSYNTAGYSMQDVDVEGHEFPVDGWVYNLKI